MNVESGHKECICAWFTQDTVHSPCIYETRGQASLLDKTQKVEFNLNLR